MPDLTATGMSGYQTGSIDSATQLVNGVSPRRAEHVNGPASGVVQIETILGSGPDLKGTVADLATRLAVEHNADGTQKLLSVAQGGTGTTSFTDSNIMLGNGTNPPDTLSPPNAQRVLAHDGIAGINPYWVAGLLFHGPTSIGSGSTLAHGGDAIIAGATNLSGINYYRTFLQTGGTITVPAGGGRLIIIASDSITINGTISAVGGGFLAGGLAGTVDVGFPGNIGTDQPGGAGGGIQGTFNGGDGGSAVWHMFTVKAGATGGTSTGPAGTQLSGSAHPGLASPFLSYGGASGGGGAYGGVTAGTGGRGGASIILVAPVITLGSGSVLNTSGGAGTAAAASGGSGSGGGGGGGAGNIFMITHNIIDNGATFTQTGGAGGAGSGSSGRAGGAGAAGIRQLLRY